MIGVDWPYLNEDDVRAFARLVREFGQAVEQTHQDATATVQKFAQAYQGASTQALQSGWAKLSAQHVDEIVEGCHVLAEALEIGADFVVAQKVEAAIQLGVMAAEFVADQAASVATLGLAEAAVPAIIGLGKALMETLKQQIIQKIMGDVIEAAAKPLFAKVEQMVAGLDWSNAQGGGSAGAGEMFSVDFEEARSHVSMLRTHSETMRSHASTLHSGLGALSF
ncbi:WXG100 family type VII secretion target [Actinocrinis puniceicyclus]|uniref:WXG100-like domain-containing protein n=1 Tax=Actinocrinis puniceicyclus TaxID=977794 RepID=UPI0034D96933